MHTASPPPALEPWTQPSGLTYEASACQVGVAHLAPVGSTTWLGHLPHTEGGKAVVKVQPVGGAPLEQGLSL
jgi:hypothetical protein